jgi:hypothetical protein
MRIRAIAAVIAIIALSVSPPVPAQNAVDVETVLYKAADTLGMLRTAREVDRLATMIFSATGTALADGRNCRLEHYQASVRYPIPDAQHSFPVPGMRVDFSCAQDSGASDRHVEVVAGEFAWDETAPGVGASPVAGAVHERLLHLWLLPHGLVKAAVAAGPHVTGSTEAGNPILTFPLPAPLDDTTVKVTFDSSVFLSHTMPTGIQRGFSHRITRVETEFNGDMIELSYADYQDWNEDDYKADVLLPGRIVQMRNGQIVLDLTLTQSNTYNPYVIMPVPAIISSATVSAVVE